MSNKLDPVFKLSNLTAEQLLEVKIDEASEGRSFGRRFKVNAGTSGSSEALLFRDILDDVKAIAKTAKKTGDLKKFEAVSKLLEKLDKADGDANLVYEGKDRLYRSMTFISRLFRRSHSTRIIKLQKSVTENMDALDPAKRLAALKQLPDNSLGKSIESRKLAKIFFDNKDYDHCLEALKETSYPGTEEKDFIAEIAKSYLTNDPEKALETIQLIEGPDTKKNTFIAEVADYYFTKEKFDKVLETINLSSNQHDKDNFTGKIANFYFDHGEYEKAAETINLVRSLIYLPTNLIKKILDQYIEDKKYEKALDLLPNYRGTQFDYAIRIGNLCCDGSDFENAHKAIELIHKQGHLHPNEKKASEALIKRVVTHYCVSEMPEKALEIVEPMFVASQYIKDLSTKNALLKEIAEAYIAIGQIDEALTTHDKILPKFELDNAFFMKAAEAYFAKNEPQRALLTIGKCGGLQFRDGVEMLKQKYQAAINQ